MGYVGRADVWPPGCGPLLLAVDLAAEPQAQLLAQLAPRGRGGGLGVSQARPLRRRRGWRRPPGSSGAGSSRGRCTGSPHHALSTSLGRCARATALRALGRSTPLTRRGLATARSHPHVSSRLGRDPEPGGAFGESGLCASLRVLVVPSVDASDARRHGDSSTPHPLVLARHTELRSRHERLCVSSC